MVSDFAVAQCGQVMTDSRIMVPPKACSRYRRLRSGYLSVIRGAGVCGRGRRQPARDTGLAPGSTHNRPWTSSEPDRAKHDDEQRRHATYRCKDGADCTRRDEGAVTHGRVNSSAPKDTPPPSSHG